MCEGFIKLHRTLFNHWIFADAEKFKAFVDLIQLARFRDSDLLIGNEVVSIKRGSFYTSELKLAERWKWGRYKTRSFLKLLEKEKMITKKTTTVGTIITVENYGFYQDDTTTVGTTNQQRTNNEPTTDKHRTNIEPHTKEECIRKNKNEEERKERKEYIAKHKYGEYKHVLLTDEQHTKLVNEFGISIANASITYLDEYIEMKGYKAKNHYLCIKKWVVDAVKKKTSGTTDNLKNLFKEAQDEENGISTDTDNPF